MHIGVDMCTSRILIPVGWTSFRWQPRTIVCNSPAPWWKLFPPGIIPLQVTLRRWRSCVEAKDQSNITLQKLLAKRIKYQNQYQELFSHKTLAEVAMAEV